MALTPKKKKFADEFIKCGNQSQAYRLSYKCKKMKDETITKRASELMKDGDVKGRIDELQSKIEKKNILTAQQLQEELTRYILDEKEEECIVIEANCNKSTQARLMNKKVQPKDKLKAVELLCKLAGYNLEKGETIAPVTINFNRNYD